jgi:hypothetical protein
MKKGEKLFPQTLAGPAFAGFEKFAVLHRRHNWFIINALFITAQNIMVIKYANKLKDKETFYDCNCNAGIILLGVLSAAYRALAGCQQI